MLACIDVFAYEEHYNTRSPHYSNTKHVDCFPPPTVWRSCSEWLMSQDFRFEELIIEMLSTKVASLTFIVKDQKSPFVTFVLFSSRIIATARVLFAWFSFLQSVILMLTLIPTVLLYWRVCFLALACHNITSLNSCQLWSFGQTVS